MLELKKIMNILLALMTWKKKQMKKEMKMMLNIMKKTRRSCKRK